MRTALYYFLIFFLIVMALSSLMPTPVLNQSIIFSDDFNTGTLDHNKWQKGTNAGNQASVANNALDLRSNGTENGWVVTRHPLMARNTTVCAKLRHPNNDGDIGISPTFTSSAPYGIYSEKNWYRFYTHRYGPDEAYRLYVQWKKNGNVDGVDVTGNLTINSTVYLQLRFDNRNIYFEVSFDGAGWTEVYTEAFDLPGYSLDSSFYYELAGYYTEMNEVLTVDDFSITTLTATTAHLYTPYFDANSFYTATNDRYGLASL